MAAIAALTTGIDDALAMREEYKRRRDYVYGRLQEMNLEVVKPDGAFYFFVKLPKGYDSSFDFALKLAKEGKVAVVPGSAFTVYGEGYFRISYACSMKTLEQALNRMQSFLQA